MAMKRRYAPRSYQDAIAAHISEHPRCNVWAGMGVGKTVSTLTALNSLYNGMGETEPTLVLAPLRVAQSTWPDEVEKWAHLGGLPLVSVTGDATERAAALKRDAAVYAMNYDNIPWLFDHLDGRWPFKTVVADEATRLKNFRITQGGKRSAYLGSVAHKKVERWINLTGTPAPNGLSDLWGQAWFLDEGKRLNRSFDAFEKQWFAWKRSDPNDPYKKTKFLMDGAQMHIENRLRDLTITVRASDFLDLPPLIENVIEVDMPPSARRHYRDLEKELFTRLASGEEVEAFNAASLTMKCLQCANGAIYLDPNRYPSQNGDPVWIEVHDAKLQALESVVEEAAGAPVLVAYHFKSDLARIQRAFPQARTLDTDPGTIRDWNAGRIPMLLAHPASAGHGLNLQDGGNILVFFGLWWDLEQHEQIVERIGPARQAQSGHNRPVHVHRIVTRGTIDRQVLMRLRTKASVQDLLLEAMKEQGCLN
jgi:SNF2 family DNA or RNA helicase